MSAQPYIALLRGINVSGQKIILMQDLRRHFEGAGYTDVKTYIQSGNVYFKTAPKPHAELQTELEALFQRVLGYHVETFVRTPAEMGAALQRSPFPAPAGKHEQVYLAFLKTPPDPARATEFTAFADELDQYAVDGQEVYIHSFKNLPGKSKFTPGFLEKKLKLPATTRNWATVKILSEY